MVKLGQITPQNARTNTLNCYSTQIDNINSKIDFHSRLGRDFIFLHAETPYIILNHFETQGFIVERVASELGGNIRLSWLKV